MYFLGPLTVGGSGSSAQLVALVLKEFDQTMLSLPYRCLHPIAMIRPGNSDPGDCSGLFEIREISHSAPALDAYWHRWRKTLACCK
jgi:hypothetical protein